MTVWMKPAIYGEIASLSVRANGISATSDSLLTSAMASREVVAAKFAERGYSATFHGIWTGGASPHARGAAAKLRQSYFFVSHMEEGGLFVSDPAEIEAAIPDLDWIVVTPWIGDPPTDPIPDTTPYGDSVPLAADVAAEYRREDPFLKELFGVSGPSAGVILLPVQTSISGNPGIGRLPMRIPATNAFRDHLIRALARCTQSYSHGAPERHVIESDLIPSGLVQTRWTCTSPTGWRGYELTEAGINEFKRLTQPHWISN